VLRPEPDERRDGPEGFFLEDPHVRLGILEDRRFEESPAEGVSPTPRHHRGPLIRAS